MIKKKVRRQALKSFDILFMTVYLQVPVESVDNLTFTTNKFNPLQNPIADQ